MVDVVIVGPVRTAIGKFGGALRDIPVQKLGAHVIKEVIRRTGIEPDAIDEVIMGNVVSAGLGQNPARQAAIYAGIPTKAGAVTVNKVCGSGMKAVMIASSEIKAGDVDVVIAGGMESMDTCPYLLRKARYGYRLGNNEIVDAMVYDGLWDVYNDFHMGMTGEIIAEKFGITREDADEFALWSHQKAGKAIKEGLFKDEIAPYEIPQRKGEPIIFDTDEGVRFDTSMEKLSRLPPVFKKDGLVTAGNASQISNGASAMLITSLKKCDDLGLKPIAKINGYAFAGVEPEMVMYAPIPTVKKLMNIMNTTIEDYDLFEHNEAFATASVAVMRELNVPRDRFNVHGGAVALGHPIGCSGARIMTTLIHALRNYGKKRGIATACLGGGNATAIDIEIM